MPLINTYHLIALTLVLWRALWRARNNFKAEVTNPIKTLNVTRNLVSGYGLSNVETDPKRYTVKSKQSQTQPLNQVSPSQCKLVRQFGPRGNPCHGHLLVIHNAHPHWPVDQPWMVQMKNFLLILFTLLKPLFEILIPSGMSDRVLGCLSYTHSTCHTVTFESSWLTLTQLSQAGF